VGTEVVAATGDSRLAELTLRDVGSGATETVTADGLFVLIGARPHTGWLPQSIERDPRGFLLTGSDIGEWPLDRTPAMLETSMPGDFAAAVGQGAAAIQQVHEYLTAVALGR
jgi:thioredoxin reductase (NADPH)